MKWKPWVPLKGYLGIWGNPLPLVNGKENGNYFNGVIQGSGFKVWGLE